MSWIIFETIRGHTVGRETSAAKLMGRAQTGVGSEWLSQPHGLGITFTLSELVSLSVKWEYYCLPYRAVARIK